MKTQQLIQGQEAINKPPKGSNMIFWPPVFPFWNYSLKCVVRKAPESLWDENIGEDLSLSLISSVISDILISLLSLSRDQEMGLKACRCTSYCALVDLHLSLNGSHKGSSRPISGYFNYSMLGMIWDENGAMSPGPLVEAIRSCDMS